MTFYTTLRIWVNRNEVLYTKRYKPSVIWEETDIYYKNLLNISDIEWQSHWRSRSLVCPTKCIWIDSKSTKWRVTKLISFKNKKIYWCKALISNKSFSKICKSSHTVSDYSCSTNGLC